MISNKTISIESSVFRNNGSIPSKFTCDDVGINPPLSIRNVPKDAKSLVLIMTDPDIPETAKKSFGIDVWDHWVAFNIPTNITEIKEGENPPGILGKNTRGNNTYGPPCPPDREHRYFFKVYALDTLLNLPTGSNRIDVEKAMSGHIIATGELIGLYNRIK